MARAMTAAAAAATAAATGFGSYKWGPCVCLCAVYVRHMHTPLRASILKFEYVFCASVCAYPPRVTALDWANASTTTTTTLANTRTTSSRTPKHTAATLLYSCWHELAGGTGKHAGARGSLWGAGGGVNVARNDSQRRHTEAQRHTAHERETAAAATIYVSQTHHTLALANPHTKHNKKKTTNRSYVSHSHLARRPPKPNHPTNPPPSSNSTLARAVRETIVCEFVRLCCLSSSSSVFGGGEGTVG